MEEVALENFCADLICLEKLEAFPLRLLRDIPSGTWVRVSAMCKEIGLEATWVPATLAATWLPDPEYAPQFSIIIFYNADTLQFVTAQYNRERLLEKSTMRK